MFNLYFPLNIKSLEKNEMVLFIIELKDFLTCSPFSLSMYTQQQRKRGGQVRLVYFLKYQILTYFQKQGKLIFMWFQDLYLIRNKFITCIYIYYIILIFNLQVPTIPFNRALLLNVGVLESLKVYDYQCFIFHDVDLLPENDYNMYNCPENPRHMSVAVDRMGYKSVDNVIFILTKLHNPIAMVSFCVVLYLSLMHWSQKYPRDCSNQNCTILIFQQFKKTVE